jgi:hypothetical protein
MISLPEKHGPHEFLASFYVKIGKSQIQKLGEYLNFWGRYGHPGISGFSFFPKNSLTSNTYL